MKLSIIATIAVLAATPCQVKVLFDPPFYDPPGNGVFSVRTNKDGGNIVSGGNIVTSNVFLGVDGGSFYFPPNDADAMADAKKAANAFATTYANNNGCSVTVAP